MIRYLLIKLGIICPSCPECGGSLFTWSYGKLKCNRDGDTQAKHTIY